MRPLFVLLLTLAALLGASSCALAQDTPASQTAWRLLDYVAVDYGGAVQDGRIVSAAEYAEMIEFTASVRRLIAEARPTNAQPLLLREAEALQQAVARKAPPTDVAGLARSLGEAVLAAYPTAMAPARPPDLRQGAAVYQQQCSGCHGAAGRGDGPNAKGLAPPPIDFTDRSRARERSLFGLYQVITQGLDGTAMASYGRLSAADRWALAFYVGQFAYPPADAARGERLWRSDPVLHAQLPDLLAVAQSTPAQLAEKVGEDRAVALVAHLRRSPDAAIAPPASSLGTARTKLAAGVEAYESGARRLAGELALSAYLDGFEPVEPALSARDKALMVRIETRMAALRSAISSGAPPAEVRAEAEQLSALFDAAERALAPEQASAVSTFAGAFTILLREGLEALLIVVAMVAFLRKANRRDVLPYVHAGWVAALAAGGATWMAATYLVSISGASRELTEGFGSLIAAAVLVSVGIWMHSKSRADAWQAYVRDKLTAALSGRSAWLLFLLAFLVVYREVFETILFFAALWTQGSAAAVVAGVAAAAIVLAAAGWVLLTYSRRLPIGQFFALSSILMAVLAVVLAGKGVAGLQEAGLLDVRPLAGIPRVAILGLYPTLQGLLAQLLTTALLVIGFWSTGRSTRAPA